MDDRYAKSLELPFRFKKKNTHLKHIHILFENEKYCKEPFETIASCNSINIRPKLTPSPETKPSPSEEDPLNIDWNDVRERLFKLCPPMKAKILKQENQHPWHEDDEFPTVTTNIIHCSYSLTSLIQNPEEESTWIAYGTSNISASCPSLIPPIQSSEESTWIPCETSNISFSSSSLIPPIQSSEESTWIPYGTSNISASSSSLISPIQSSQESAWIPCETSNISASGSSLIPTIQNSEESTPIPNETSNNINSSSIFAPTIQYPEVENVGIQCKAPNFSSSPHLPSVHESVEESAGSQTETSNVIPDSFKNDPIYIDFGSTQNLEFYFEIITKARQADKENEKKKKENPSNQQAPPALGKAVKSMEKMEEAKNKKKKSIKEKFISFIRCC